VLLYCNSRHRNDAQQWLLDKTLVFTVSTSKFMRHQILHWHQDNHYNYDQWLCVVCKIKCYTIPQCKMSLNCLTYVKYFDSHITISEQKMHIMCQWRMSVINLCQQKASGLNNTAKQYRHWHMQGIKCMIISLFLYFTNKIMVKANTWHLGTSVWALTISVTGLIGTRRYGRCRFGATLTFVFFAHCSVTTMWTLANCLLLVSLYSN